MSDSRTFYFLGTPCIVHFNDAQVGQYLVRLMGRFVATAVSKDPSHFTLECKGGKEFHLSAGDEVVAADLSREEGTMRLLVELNRVTVRHLDSFSVHCGAVAGPGGAILFPGEAGSGKSTLTAACTLQGFDYVTDEIVYFDSAGLVLPFPKPIWLAGWSRSALGLVDSDLAFVAPGFKVPVTPEDLGATVATGRLPVSDIVVIERSGDRETLDPISAADVVAALLSNIYHVDQRAQEGFRIAAETARSARGWRLKLGHPDSAAALLREVVFSS